MDQLATHRDESNPREREADAEREFEVSNRGASLYLARVSAWWMQVTAREGCQPMSYYDQ